MKAVSHCTNFEFQYTDRNLILQAFNKLGIKCYDDTVYSYASSFDKTRGIPSAERPAICAERNGFHYFVENYGNHYELSMEKHNMTSQEARISEQMADEFKKQYVKCAAEEVMHQMRLKGQNCLMVENSQGFEIKFGALYDKSLLVKLENGRVVESVHGIKGKSCQSITEALENMLSSADVELNTEWTEEYYEPDDSGALKVYDLGF